MKVYISPDAMQKLSMYVDEADGEISGLGKVLLDNKKMFIQDIYLLPQVSGYSDTELDAEAVPQFMMEMIERGEQMEQIKLWWHSHAKMNVFWSGTDTETSSKFSNGWMLSLVMNKEGKMLCRLDVYEPVDLVVDNILLEVAAAPPSAEFVAAIKEEVKRKVKSKPCEYQGNGSNGNVVGEGNGVGSSHEGWWERDPKTGVMVKKGLVGGKIVDIDSKKHEAPVGRGSLMIGGRDVDDMSDTELEAWKDFYGCS
jgi:hypothetical protein